MADQKPLGGLALALLLSCACAGPLERQDPSTLPPPARLTGMTDWPRAVVRSGPGELLLKLALPKGWRLHPKAPFRYRVAETTGALVFDPKRRKGEPVNPRFPIRLPYRVEPGIQEAVLDIVFHACQGDDPSTCRGQARVIRVPVQAWETAPATEIEIPVGLLQ